MTPPNAGTVGGKRRKRVEGDGDDLPRVPGPRDRLRFVLATAPVAVLVLATPLRDVLGPERVTIVLLALTALWAKALWDEIRWRRSRSGRSA